jgi:hypothetical protein
LDLNWQKGVGLGFCLKEEIDSGIRAMQALSKFVPESGLKEPEKAAQKMDELISPEFEPYFSANAALHLLAKCERCGRCCLEEKTIAVSIDDCRKIARHLGLSLKRVPEDGELNGAAFLYAVYRAISENLDED